MFVIFTLTNVYCLGSHCNGIHLICPRECWHRNYWGNSFLLIWCLLSFFFFFFLYFLISVAGKKVGVAFHYSYYMFFYGIKVRPVTFHNLIQNWKMAIRILILIYSICNRLGWGVHGMQQTLFLVLNLLHQSLLQLVRSIWLRLGVLWKALPWQSQESLNMAAQLGCSPCAILLQIDMII